jgi:hypothetical protein
MCRLLLLPLHRYHQAKQHLTQDREAASSALGQAGAGSIVNNRIGYHGPLLAHSSRFGGVLSWRVRESDFDGLR